MPYLVKPERTVERPELEYKGNLRLEPDPLPTGYDGYTCVGNYGPYSWTGDGTEWYYGVTRGMLFKGKITTADLNGFRAYFILPQGATARLSILGVETDGIDDAEAAALPGQSDRIYNLQGLYMGDDMRRLPSGIYIVNGRKTIVK